nr:hypothetical protein [Tanacetum cinerariifolium]GEV77868.1 hypothetical protein [Tanacetum cinerariifolium]
MLRSPLLKEHVIKDGVIEGKSGNDADVDDANIKLVYDEEPKAGVQLTAECNVFATGQRHAKQPKFNNEGRVDQDAEQFLGKPVLQPLRNQSVIKQPVAFKSERPKISKPQFSSQVDVKKDLPKLVTQQYLPKGRKYAFTKPDHVIASSESRNSSKNMPRFSSNDMVHRVDYVSLIDFRYSPLIVAILECFVMENNDGMNKREAFNVSIQYEHGDDLVARMQRMKGNDGNSVAKTPRMPIRGLNNPYSGVGLKDKSLNEALKIVKTNVTSFGESTNPSWSTMNPSSVTNEQNIWSSSVSTSSFTSSFDDSIVVPVPTEWTSYDQPSTIKPTSETPIVKSVDINMKPTSYAGATGASTKDQTKAKASFRSLVADKKPPRCQTCNIYGHTVESCPKKVVTTPVVTDFNDGFQQAVNKKRNNKRNSASNMLPKGVPVVKGFKVGKDFASQPKAPKAGSNGGGTHSEVSSKAGSSKNTKEGAFLTEQGFVLSLMKLKKLLIRILREEHAHYLLAFQEAQLDEERFLKQKAKVQADFMVRDVINIEVKNVIFSMGDDKAPGPDGLLLLSLRKLGMWWVVILLVLLGIFFSNGKLLKELNHTIISLILMAYDTVDWKFLETILVGFGFHSKMVQWIMVCVSGASYSICANGNLHGWFKDDLFLFARCHLNSVSVIIDALEEFKQVSRHVPSIPKSTTFFCNVPNAIKVSIKNFMPFAEGEMKKGKAKVAWDSVCKPKHEGGLGDASWGWRKLLQIRSTIRPFIWHKINNEKSTSVWFDRWAYVCPLKDMLSNRDIARSGFSLDDSVPLLLDDMDDVILWHDRDGDLQSFLVAYVWDMIWSQADMVQWCGLRFVFYVAWTLYLLGVILGLCSMWHGLYISSAFIIPISKGKTVISILSSIVVARKEWKIVQEEDFVSGSDCSSYSIHGVVEAGEGCTLFSLSKVIPTGFSLERFLRRQTHLDRIFSCGVAARLLDARLTLCSHLGSCLA